MLYPNLQTLSQGGECSGTAMSEPRSAKLREGLGPSR
jgi:hypothetical protein